MPNYSQELVAFCNNMFTDKDGLYYSITINKIIVYAYFSIRYDISTYSGDVFHVRIFEGDKLIDEAFFYKNPETEEYNEIIV